VAKAILLLDPDGLALGPATLCAETAEEARKQNLPVFTDVVAQLSAGAELRVSGSACYQLFRAGQHVAMLEVFEIPY
jgi:hypothetical protein